VRFFSFLRAGNYSSPLYQFPCPPPRLPAFRSPPPFKPSYFFFRSVFLQAGLEVLPPHSLAFIVSFFAIWRPFLNSPYFSRPGPAVLNSPGRLPVFTHVHFHVPLQFPLFFVLVARDSPLPGFFLGRPKGALYLFYGLAPTSSWGHFCGQTYLFIGGLQPRPSCCEFAPSLCVCLFLQLFRPPPLFPVIREGPAVGRFAGGFFFFFSPHPLLKCCCLPFSPLLSPIQGPRPTPPTRIFAIGDGADAPPRKTFTFSS